MKKLLALALGLLVAFGVSAQTYPNRPIRLIVPFAAGGGTDLVARALAQRLSKEMGQSVVVDNRVGASGVIGTDLTAKAAPDGYTVMIATPTFTVNPALIAKLPYNTPQDFTPVSLVATSPHLLAIHPSIPARNVTELVAYAKQRNEPLTYSSGSVGGSSHLAGEFFSSLAGVKMLHIPYKGTGEAASSLVAGTVNAAFLDVQTLLPLVKAGRLRAIAVTGAKRLQILPDLPTVAEAGPAFAGFESGVWYGIIAPGATPAPLVARLNAEIVKALSTAEMQKALLDVAAEPVGGAPQAFSELIKAEIERWGAAVKRAGIVASQ